MFWALLASGIMLITGEGDDALIQKKTLEAMEEAIKEVVQDDERQEAALKNVEGFRQLLMEHREVLGEVGDCLEKLDRSYNVTKEAYRVCSAGVGGFWAKTEDTYLRLDREQKMLLTPREMEAVGKKVLEALK